MYLNNLTRPQVQRIVTISAIVGVILFVISQVEIIPSGGKPSGKISQSTQQTAPLTASETAINTSTLPSTTSIPADSQQARSTASQPTATHVPTPTPIIVTPKPVPTDVFAAATVSARETAQAAQFGTPTATPKNVVTATYTPRPVVITRTPTPGGSATAEYRAVVATAQAFTTGTPTPFPTYVIVATETPTPSPYPTATPAPPSTATPRPTATPVMIALAGLQPIGAPTPTPQPVFPPVLTGRILFLSDALGPVRVFSMLPDGSGLAQLTSDWPYKFAEERDAMSADGTYRAFPERDKDGTARLIQLRYYDAHFRVNRLLTQFGTGTAWSPSWSPAGEDVVFVSNESGNDEIWVVHKDSWPAIQLTHNTWEWDHHPSWSPDGKQILFSSNRTGQQQLWLMNADGSTPHPITDGTFEAWDPVWVK
jgi:hypothetical protein